MTDNDRHTASAEPQIGYKSPPTEKRFQKGRSGNPRGRPKESRNLCTVLSEVLNQPVTFKQSGKSKQLTKGDAVIRVLMNMGSKGDRRAADAVISLIGKIERLVDPPEAERKNVGVMLVPGTAKSIEEFAERLAKKRERDALREEQWTRDAASLEAKVRLNRGIMMSHKGTPFGDKAAARFAELTNSEDYLWNPRVKRQSKPSEEEGEEYRRLHRALMAALEAVRHAKNQGPEQQRIAAKAVEDAQNEILKPYSPATSRGQLPQSDEYLTNFYVRRHLAPNQHKEETATKKEPVAKLPFDGDEYARTRTHARKEYERTHE